jgi:hypothetical protein
MNVIENKVVRNFVPKKENSVGSRATGPVLCISHHLALGDRGSNWSGS